MKTLKQFLLLGLIVASQSLFSQTLNALRLDGRTEAVSFGNTDLGIGGQDELTVMVWVKWETTQPDTADSWANIMSNNSDATNDRGQFWLQHDQNNDHYEFAVQTEAGRSHTRSNAQVTPGTWQHVAAVYKPVNGSYRMIIYINGVEDQNVSHYSGGGNIRDYHSQYHLFIGQWAHNDGRKFPGTIDDAGIWKRALSPAEINNIMSDAANLDATDPDLVGFWDMNDDLSSNTITDISDNNSPDLTGTFTPAGSTLLYNLDTCDDNILPVSLIQLDARYKGHAVHVSWETATEVNNDYFLVEHSTDGKTFRPIGQVEGWGNSNQVRSYSHIHRDVVPGSINYYRLTQFDYDGQKEVFPMVSVKSNPQEASFTVYPSPAPAGSTVSLRFSQAGSYQIQVLSADGQLLYSRTAEGISTNLSTDNLTPGMYIVRTINGHSSQTRRLVVY